MNQLEFASKSLLLFSLRRKTERIDMSSLPDEIFDRVLSELSKSQMCVEGSPFTGEYIMTRAKASLLVSVLELEIAHSYPRVRQLIAYLNALQDGDLFRIVSEDAPTMNKQLALLKTKGQAEGIDERIIHDAYLRQWGVLTTSYHHYAYGYDGLRTTIGEGDKTKRICRFCGKRMPEVTYRDVAHAISEGLGNKLLLCNEECDDCNNKLSKLESNLMHYLDVRRAMGGVLTKSDGNVPSVDGKGFVIRGDESNQAILYIEKGGLAGDLDLDKPFHPFYIKLETNESITHQGLYKSLCKMVIDLLPAGELAHFGETISWINGSVIDNELPPYWASYDRERVKQPTVDIFLSKNPGTEPYCTAIAHILDAFFIFILPEVDVDKGRYKTEQSISAHIAKFIKPYGGCWQSEDSSDYQMANPWSMWLLKPGDSQVKILPKDDLIFTRYKKTSDEKDEKVFPPFTSQGISKVTIFNVLFDRHFALPVTVEELRQVSVNFKHMGCLLDKDSSMASFKFILNFSDSSNRISYFDFGFEASIHFEIFGKYIEIGEYFCIDYHLRDYLFETVMVAADKELEKHTDGTDLEPITLMRIIDPRIVRQLYYHVPLGKERYMVVKDAELHNVGN